jgi:hypothetical protein
MIFLPSLFLPFFLSFLLSFLLLLTYVYIFGPPLHSSPPPLLERTYSALFFSNFVEEKIGDNKKDVTFLVVGDKDSYTEKFLAFLSCTRVLKATLVHIRQTSSLLPVPFA